MAIGTVRWFNATKGYGFIQPQDGGNDVFVHISAVERAGLSGSAEGQKVSYELNQARKNQRRKSPDLANAEVAAGTFVCYRRATSAHRLNVLSLALFGSQPGGMPCYLASSILDSKGEAAMKIAERRTTLPRFRRGDRIRLSELGRSGAPRTKVQTGVVFRVPGHSAGGMSIQVIFDGNRQPTRIHRSYLELDADTQD